MEIKTLKGRMDSSIAVVKKKTFMEWVKFGITWMKEKPMRMWIGGGVALIILLIILAKSSGDDGLKVAVEETGTHTITETVTASGKIYPETEVKISPEVSGEITELTISEGDTVNAGDLLVKINPTMYSSMVNQSQATVQQMRAQADQSKSNYERNKKLYQAKVISAMEFEQATNDYKAAQATFEGASASLSQSNESLRKTTILAPTAGIISALKVRLGERVVGTAQMAGTEMFTIADLDRIEVRVDVSETDIAKVKVGDTTIVEADAYRERKFTGVVSKIAVSSTANGAALQVSIDQVTNYTVHILILPETYMDLLTKTGAFPFKPGMSASVEIQTRRERGVLSIPVNAVTTRDYPDSVKKKNDNLNNASRQVVFVYDEKEKEVVLRDVKTGVQDNQFIHILEGLKAGEKVVTAPFGAIARTLKDKTGVTVVDKSKLFEAKEK